MPVSVRCWLHLGAHVNSIIEAAAITGGCTLAGAMVSALTSIRVAHVNRATHMGQAIPQTFLWLRAAQWKRVAKFLGTVTAGAGIVLVIALFLDHGHGTVGPEPPPTPVTADGGPVTPSSDSPPRSSPSCPTGLRLTSPPNNSKVPDGSKGITITGIMCGLPASNSGWLVESVPADPTSGYVIDDTASVPEPVVAKPGRWSYQDDSIGDPGTEVVRISLVQANPICAEKLSRIKPDSNRNYWMASLPTECAVTDYRDMVVTNPQ